MKLSKVAKLCKDRMSIMIVDKSTDEGALTQWVGTPEAMYPLYNLPEIDEKTIFVIFDEMLFIISSKSLRAAPGEVAACRAAPLG